MLRTQILHTLWHCKVVRTEELNTCQLLAEVQDSTTAGHLVLCCLWPIRRWRWYGAPLKDPGPAVGRENNAGSTFITVALRWTLISRSRRTSSWSQRGAKEVQKARLEERRHTLLKCSRRVDVAGGAGSSRSRSGVNLLLVDILPPTWHGLFQKGYVVTG